MNKGKIEVKAGQFYRDGFGYIVGPMMPSQKAAGWVWKAKVHKEDGGEAKVLGERDKVTLQREMRPYTENAWSEHGKAYYGDEGEIGFDLCEGPIAPPEWINDHKIGTWKVRELRTLSNEQPMSHQDRFHMYTIAGMQASNTKHHHEFGDVTIFYAETAPVNHHGEPVRKSQRYVIIADQWTGQQLRVELPVVLGKNDDDTIEKSRISNMKVSDPYVSGDDVDLSAEEAERMRQDRMMDDKPFPFGNAKS